MGSTYIAGHGQIGSYTYQAFNKLGIHDATFKSFDNFEDICLALDKGQVKYALIPTKNTAIGPVIPAHEALKKYDFIEIENLDLPIQHVLIGAKGSTLKDVKTVTSYQVALDQCKKAIATYNWEVKQHLDTAGAVRYVLEQQDPTLAAIGPNCLEVYSHIGEGTLLLNCVNDIPDNITHFKLFKKA